MWTQGAVGVMVVMHDGLVSTLGDGASGRQLNWRFDGGFVGWFATQRGRGRAVGILRLSLGGWLGGIRRGLQLLETTVSSSSSSSVVGIWNGLLRRVWRWWTNGIVWMTLGAVMLFDVVATLGAVACPTL
jgi:hypothetical protein